MELNKLFEINKSFIYGFILAVILCLIIFNLLNTNCYVTPIFSPNSEDEIISLINNAQKSIDIEMYVFTSANIQNALINARNRGVEVRVILEQEIETNEDSFYKLISNGIETKWAPRKFSRTHSKFMIIDNKLIFVGSTNFSNSALTSNREAAVLTSCSVSNFIDIFEQDWKDA
ncbi:MAG: phospholipase D-like domain-containing protein [Candidatus Micrarchaeia archaeon]|jgi:phosphatidylserine/phosphatidylglycerophosphate/cardiolipin synthase-like enzyme